MTSTSHNLSFVACISCFFTVLSESVAMFFTSLIFHHFLSHAYPFDVCSVDLYSVTRTHAHCGLLILIMCNNCVQHIFYTQCTVNVCCRCYGHSIASSWRHLIYLTMCYSAITYGLPIYHGIAINLIYSPWS